MTIAVTGATGFLGKKVVERLARSGRTVLALGRNKAIGEQLITIGIPFKSVDLTNKAEVILALKHAKAIIHCAGLSTVWASKSEFEQANVLAVEHVLEAAKMHQIDKLVHISTPSIYFDYTPKLQLTENSPLPKQFVNEYAHSKWLGEQLVRQAALGGLPAIILRPRGLFGPGDTALFPRVLKALKRNMLPLINGGEAIIDLTYIENVVDAALLALEAKSAQGQAYNITNDEPQTFRELLQQLSSCIGLSFKTKRVSYRKAYAAAKVLESVYRLLGLRTEPPLTCYGVGLVSTSMTFDISKAKNELQYKPAYTIQDGFQAFSSWYKACC